MTAEETRGDDSAAAAPGRNHLVRVTVERSDPAAQAVFVVPAAEPMVVLDVLLALQRHGDPSLVFRFSCRAGRCGTCTVRLNGTAVLACQTAVAGGAELVVEPLGGFPVVRDLVVDMAPFLDSWREVVRTMGPGATAETAPEAIDQRLLDSSRECIACGACYAACPVAASDREFLGPATLARAAGAYAPQTAGRSTVLGLRGFAGCHSVGACSVVCPRQLDPASLIRSLRRGRWGRST